MEKPVEIIIDDKDGTVYPVVGAWLEDDKEIILFIDPIETKWGKLHKIVLNKNDEADGLLCLVDCGVVPIIVRWSRDPDEDEHILFYIMTEYDND